MPHSSRHLRERVRISDLVQPPDGQDPLANLMRFKLRAFGFGKHRLSASLTCVVCGRTFDSPRDLRRGLCIADYEKYRRAKAKLQPEEIEGWEALLISRGKLLPDARASSDPFLDAIAEVRRVSSNPKPPTRAEEKAMVDDVVATGDEVIKKAAAKRKAARKLPARPSKRKG